MFYAATPGHDEEYIVCVVVCYLGYVLELCFLVLEGIREEYVDMSSMLMSVAHDTTQGHVYICGLYC